MTDDYILDAVQCESCVNAPYFPVRQPCVNCLDDHPLRVSGRHYIRNKVTNLDRIRAMSAKELALWIHNQIIDRNIGVPVETWLEFLNREVES